MNADSPAADIVGWLDLPASAAVNQRVPKKMLIENGAATAADKRQINDSIEDMFWLAALKPATIGVPAYQDHLRDYLEITVISVSLRPDANRERLAQLIHRAIPYPVFLALRAGAELTLSLAHKRWAQNEAGKTVLDGEIRDVALNPGNNVELVQQFIQSLPLGKQPQSSLHALYQGWMDAMLAWQAALVTGRFNLASSREQAAERHQALLKIKALNAEISRLRRLASKEKQINRQVELNLALKRINGELQTALELL